MNRMIRGMAGLMVALGASACGEDPSLDFGGEAPTQIQASPTVMFITQGTPEALLLRLVDDRNRSTPTSFEITNVSAGLTVELDDEYRPDYIGSDTLEFNPIQHQHRYFVSSQSAVAGSFTVSSSGISQVITVKVVATTLGAALSSSAPAVGEEVTITAPANLSFTEESQVSFSPGGTAVITDQQAKSITFIPIPGSSGEATVTNVTTDYSPTLDPQTLTTTDELEVPAVTEIPLVFSSTASVTPVTVTAAGFRFEEDFSMTIGGFEAWVVEVAGDGTSATVVLPAGQTGNPEVSGVHLSFLPSVSLSGLEGVASVTTPTTTWDGSAPDGSAPTITAGAAGTEVTFWDTWINASTSGPGPDYFGGSTKFYRLVIPSGDARTYTVNWTSDADLDVVITPTTDLNDATDGVFTGNHPETFSATLAPGSYWIGVGNWTDIAQPGVVKITVE